MKVGVTGHQDVGTDETVKWVRSVLSELVSRGDIDSGVTCLARGADQLYAQVLREQHIPFIAVIASKDYQKTFEDSYSLNTFNELLKQASNVIVLNNIRASEQAFYEAGKTLVDKSDYVIAVWNGKPAKGLGGTGDIVEYAIRKKKRVIHINTTNQTVSDIPLS